MKEKPTNQGSQELQLGELYGDVQNITRIFYLFISLALTGLIFGIVIVLTNNNILTAIILAISIVPVSACLYLVRAKRFEMAAIFLGGVLIVMNTILSTSGLGIHSLNNIAFPVILIIASLVTNKRHMFFLTFLTVICISWLVFGELWGLYTPGVLVRSVPGDFFSASMIVILTAIMVRRLTASMFQSFSHAQKEVAERRSVEDNLRQREAILEAVTFTAEQFLKSSDWRENINSALERLGRTTHATHAYLFEDHLNAQGEPVTSMRYEWTAPGYPSDLDGPYFQGSLIQQEGFEEQVEQLKRGEVRIGKFSTFNPVEREIMLEHGVKAILEVPVFVSGREWGAIGFDDFENEREWSIAEVDALKIAAGILSAAIQRQEAESAIHESERIYRQAIQAAGMVPYYRDYVNGCYSFLGEGIMEITGYSPSELTPEIWEQMTLRGFPRGSMAHLTYEEADRLSEQGFLRHWECDYLILNRNGQERWVSDSSIQVVNDKNVRIGVVGIVQDITDRKLVESNLRQRESILEAITFAAERFLKTPDWRENIDDVLERLGRTINASHVYLFEHFVGADDVEYSLLKYEWTAAGQVSDFENPQYQTPKPINLSEGTTDYDLRQGRVFSGNFSTLQPAERDRLIGLGVKTMVEVPLIVDGKWWGTFGLDDMERVRDWSLVELDALKIAAEILGAAIERQKAESAVHESDRIYRQAIQASGMVPYYQDYRFDRYTFMGQGIQAITGYAPEEMSASLLNSIVRKYEFPGGLNGMDPNEVSQMARRGELSHWKCDYRILSRDGEDRWVSDTAIDLFDEMGISYASIGILQDITDRKRIETDLRRRESMLQAVTFAAEQFLRSPDWRNGINAVLERLGQEFNASHAYLFENHVGNDGSMRNSLRYEWAAPGQRSDLDNPIYQNAPDQEEEYNRYYEILNSGEPFVGSSASLTEREKNGFNQAGIKAILEMRIVVDGRQWGTLGFDDMTGDRDWTSMEVDVLKVAVNVLGAAIKRQLDEDMLKSELAERRRAEQALRFSEEKFSKAFHDTRMLMTIENAQNLFVDANKAFEEVFGIAHEDIIGHSARELNIFYDPADAALLQREYREKGHLKDFEIRFRRRNGDIGFALLSSEVFSVEGENYTLTSGLDITERKRAEEKYHSIFDNSIDGIFQSTPDGRFINVNNAMARIHGYDSPEDMIESIHDISRQIYTNQEQERDVRRRLNAGEKLTSYETLQYRKDGTTFWSSMNAQAIRDENGNVLYYEGTVEDVTPRKEAETEREKLIKELAEKNAEAETLRETTSIVTSTLDVNEAVQRILEQLKQVVPYDSASVWLYENNIARMVGLDGLPDLQETDMVYMIDESEPDYRLISDDVPYILIEDIQEKYPKFREMPNSYIHGWLSVALKARGKLIGFISLDSRQTGRFSEKDARLALNYANQVAVALENARLFSDLQKELDGREKLIYDLENKNVELERFTYTVSHDLKSPLVTINGFLGYLEQDAFSGNVDRLRRDMQRIQEAVQKMQRLLNELLELSRIGRIMNAPETVSFGELVKEALEIVHGRLEARGVRVEVQDGLPSVYGDRPRLIEVLQNLIDNAAKYMGGQLHPRVEIGRRGDENGKPVFFVKDNGIGIEPEHYERVFGLFNKLDAKSEGTGVGLALVKRIIEVHGGRVWIESKAGEGSTFLFTLPAGPAS